MVYKAQTRISNDLLAQPTIQEEQLFRQLAYSIVQELPIDELKQLFKLKVVYGFESELEKAYEEYDKQNIGLIHRLIRDHSSLFTGEIDIPK